MVNITTPLVNKAHTSPKAKKMSSLSRVIYGHIAPSSPSLPPIEAITHSPSPSLSTPPMPEDKPRKWERNYGNRPQIRRWPKTVYSSPQNSSEKPQSSSPTAVASFSPHSLSSTSSTHPCTHPCTSARDPQKSLFFEPGPGEPNSPFWDKPSTLALGDDDRVSADFMKEVFQHFNLSKKNRELVDGFSKVRDWYVDSEEE